MGAVLGHHIDKAVGVGRPGAQIDGLVNHVAAAGGEISVFHREADLSVRAGVDGFEVLDVHSGPYMVGAIGRVQSADVAGEDRHPKSSRGGRDVGDGEAPVRGVSGVFRAGTDGRDAAEDKHAGEDGHCPFETMQFHS